MPLSRNPPRAGIGIRHGTAARTGRTGIRTAVASRSWAPHCRLLRSGNLVARHQSWRRANLMELLANAQNENAPGTASEGIRLASEDRGDRPSVGGEVSRWSRVLRTRKARTNPRRALAARLSGFRRCGGVGLTWSEGFCVVFLREVRGEGAHLTARAANAQVLFCAFRLLFCLTGPSCAGLPKSRASVQPFSRWAYPSTC